MRGGGFSVQQALTPDAGNMVKQAMALARRRGHAQVTPLHVASTMLSAPTGLLRTACLQSHTHPLQCRALELCFNVSLNRLQTSTGSPMLVPCISNALVAAFKRAQAHHRRGSIENQQQPILAVKIEPEQLIISILDDPGVSRVMKEAGFSSPQVKSKVEQSVSLMISSSKPKASKLLTSEVMSEDIETFVDKRRKSFSEIENETIQECSTMTEACGKRSSNVITALPAWLQLYKKENQHKNTDSDNSMCDSIHKRPSDKTLDLSSLSPSSSSSNTYAPTEPNLRLFTPKHDNKLTATLLMDPVASSSDAIEVEYASRFKEMNAENLETLCNALRSKAPRQKDVIPEIAKAILKCRSGSTPRKLRNGNRKEETWLLFQGVDVEAKEKIGRELAKLVFGSQNNFVSISLSSFSSSSMEDLRKKKRRRDEDSWSYTQRLFEAVSCNPHRVFFVEDIEEADYLCQMSFKRAIEKGRLQSGNGEEAFLRDAIVILSCERFSSRSRACSPLEDERKMRSPCLSLDLNLSLDHDDGNDDDDDGHCSDHIGLLDAVDAHVLFNGSSTRFM